MALATRDTLPLPEIVVHPDRIQRMGLDRRGQSRLGAWGEVEGNMGWVVEEFPAPVPPYESSPSTMAVCASNYLTPFGAASREGAELVFRLDAFDRVALETGNQPLRGYGGNAAEKYLKVTPEPAVFTGSLSLKNRLRALADNETSRPLVDVACFDTTGKCLFITEVKMGLSQASSEDWGHIQGGDAGASLPLEEDDDLSYAAVPPNRVFNVRTRYVHAGKGKPPVLDLDDE